MTDMDALQLKVGQLTAGYVEKLPGHVVDLKSIAERLVHEPDQMVMNELCERAHKLAGSAGSYGFTDLGIAAKDLENICVTSVEGGDVLEDTIDGVTMALIMLISIIEDTIKSNADDT